MKDGRCAGKKRRHKWEYGGAFPYYSQGMRRWYLRKRCVRCHIHQKKGGFATMNEATAYREKGQ